ncbi:hypothetical protein Moror_6194 [Moniliophthora roreri MCA 2997]|uniref:Uncharacterized protein n=1 Tax=Moniliophthora roreri (strain MCA 2997) TaxID=1381753 RepID=V2XYK3_MONRO|nr:hypothetical protein Moror_6194 [Moniliophthora roreri MCA 2997]
MSFSNSTKVSIQGSNTFNHVQGNQVNSVVIADVVTIKKPKLEHSKFGEFEFVKRGGIINARDLHPEDWDWIWRNGEIFGRHKVRRMICTIELHPDRHPKFIAVMYEGEEAFESWEEDFEHFCGVRPAATRSWDVIGLGSETRFCRDNGYDSGGWWANMLQVVNPREFVFRLHSNGQDSGKGGYRHPYGYSMQSRTRETKKAISIADPQRSDTMNFLRTPRTSTLAIFLKKHLPSTSSSNLHLLTTRPADQRFPRANASDYVFLCSLQLLYLALLSRAYGRLPLTPPFNTGSLLGASIVLIQFETIGAETERGRFEEVTERHELAKTAWWEAIAGSDLSVFGL